MLIIFLVIAAFLLMPADALAWGMGTHLYIAQKIAGDMALDGPHDLASLIARNQAAFALGNIAPDIFAVRDWFLRPSAPLVHGWQMAHRLLGRARKESEAAFSLGYASHLASDVICHNFFVPQFIFMWEHRFKFTHVVAETQVEGYIGHPWPPCELGRLFGADPGLNAFFAETAGIGKRQFARNRALLQKAMEFKVKSGIDLMAFRLHPRGRVFAEKAGYHLRLSVNLAAATVRDPYRASSLDYCPEGGGRMNLSRLRRRLSVRSKSIERFRKEREEGKYEYLHRVPSGLTGNV